MKTFASASQQGVNITSGSKNITVRNGTITNMGAEGILGWMGSFSFHDLNGRFEDLAIDGNGALEHSTSDGLYVGPGVIVKNVTATGNAGRGIVTSDGSDKNSVARNNTGMGISANESVISNATARNNGSHGISANRGSVSHSTSRENGGDGIRVDQKGCGFFLYVQQQYRR
ncbi:MAG: hypothetical protein LAT83_12145 [Kiritimatiellae bacterium]|nr:hypothetical protein [Kiritimatiellia bacterium]